MTSPLSFPPTHTSCSDHIPTTVSRCPSKESLLETTRGSSRPVSRQQALTSVRQSARQQRSETDEQAGDVRQASPQSFTVKTLEDRKGTKLTQHSDINTRIRNKRKCLKTWSLLSSTLKVDEKREKSFLCIFSINTLHHRCNKTRFIYLFIIFYIYYYSVKTMHSREPIDTDRWQSNKNFIYKFIKAINSAVLATGV